MLAMATLAMAGNTTDPVRWPMAIATAPMTTAPMTTAPTVLITLPIVFTPLPESAGSASITSIDYTLNLSHISDGVKRDFSEFCFFFYGAYRGCSTVY